MLDKDIKKSIVNLIKDCDMEEIFDTHSPILETIMGNLMNHLTQTQMLEILKSVVCDKAKKALVVNANTYIN